MILSKVLNFLIINQLYYRNMELLVYHFLVENNNYMQPILVINILHYL